MRPVLHTKLQNLGLPFASALTLIKPLSFDPLDGVFPQLEFIRARAP